MAKRTKKHGPPDYGWSVGNDLKFHHEAEKAFTHTPSWPGGYAEADRETCQRVRISVQLDCYGRGFTREQIEELATRFEKIARRKFSRKDTLEVSAIC